MTNPSLPPNHENVDIGLEKVALQLAGDAYAIIDKKYGLESENPLGYHNVTHSRDLVEDAIIIADMAIAQGKIKSRGKALLIISGAYHDIEQDLGSGENEAASVRIAHTAMRAVEGVYTQEDETAVDSMIMATQIWFDEDGIMRQSAGEDDYLAQLLADADLSSLGRDTETYLDRSEGLYKELFGNNPTDADRLAYLTNQVRLLTQHEWYTPEAQEAFPNQEENLRYSEDALSSPVK